LAIPDNRSSDFRDDEGGYGKAIAHSLAVIAGLDPAIHANARQAWT